MIGRRVSPRHGADRTVRTVRADIRGHSMCFPTREDHQKNQAGRIEAPPGADFAIRGTTRRNAESKLRISLLLLGAILSGQAALPAEANDLLRLYRLASTRDMQLDA